MERGRQSAPGNSGKEKEESQNPPGRPAEQIADGTGTASIKAEFT